MRLSDKLTRVWQDHEKNLPSKLRERRYCYCENSEQKDILFLGLNPSFSDNALKQAVKYNARSQWNVDLKENIHFKRMLSCLEHRLFRIDLIDDFAYADLLYYRTNDQVSMVNRLIDDVNGLMFLEDQLVVTQQLIENTIRPKVIILSSWEVANFFGLLGKNGEFTWLGYDLELIAYTESEHPVYQIKGIIDDRALPDVFAQETNLVGTYVICYPYLETGVLKENQRLLSAWEIKGYNELASSEKNTEISPFPQYENIVDVKILLKYPQLYADYFLEKGNINEKNKKVVAVLQGFRKFTSKEMAKTLFAYLSKENYLTEAEIDNLSYNTEYCKEQLGLSWFALAEVTKMPVKEAERMKNMYFTTPIFFLGKRIFFLNKEWSQENRNKLEKWFVELMIKSN